MPLDLTVVRPSGGSYPGFPQSGGTPAAGPATSPPSGAPGGPAQPPGAGGQELGTMVIQYTYAKAMEAKQQGNMQVAQMYAQAAQLITQAEQAGGGQQQGPPQGPEPPQPSGTAPYQGQMPYGQAQGDVPYRG